MPMNSGKDYKARQTDVAQPLMAGGPVGGNQGGDFIAQAVAYPLDLRNAMRDPEKHDEQNRQGCGLGDDGDPAPTLTKAHVHGVVTSAVNETVGTLCAEAGPNTHGCRGVSGSQTMLSGYIQPTVNMYGTDMYNGAITGDVAATLGARSGDGLSSGPSCIGNFACNQGVDAWPNMQVRRLTPTECERLQGFPDGYTLVPHRGKPAADGPRYKSLGNSMAVPVMAWIGKRIDQAIQ
jgi:site-specific DNA-cytosine methylase